MSDKSNTQSGGIGFLALLTLLFIGLKLTNYIEWSWLWVLSPIWIPFVFIFFVVLPAVFLFVKFISKKQKVNKWRR